MHARVTKTNKSVRVKRKVEKKGSREKPSKGKKMPMENPQIMPCKKVKRPSSYPGQKKIERGGGKRGKEGEREKSVCYHKTKDRIPAQKKVRIQERR